MTGRIRWEDEPEGYAVTSDGFIGPIGWRWRAFKIWNPDTRVDPRPFLTSDLPGWDRSQHHGTPNELKAEAERWLSEFVASLGAVFPDEPAGGLLAHAGPIRSALLNSAAAEGVGDSSRKMYFDAVAALDRELDAAKETGQ